MALYEDLVSIDIIEPIEEALRKGNLPLPNTEGKIILENAWHPHRTWVDVNYDLNRRCDIWHGIYFEYYRMIPKGCRNCWKVTLKPRNLKELFLISDVQHKTQRNSKAGLEKRDYTGNMGGYSAFWYGDLKKGLEGGRELYDLVCKDLEGITDLKPVLKRGCTEMEIAFKDSSKWDDIAEEREWDKREKQLDDFFVFGKQVEKPILVYKTNSLLKWIKYAKDHGDPTVAEFIEQNSNVPKPETYHQGGKHSNMNFKSTWGEDGKDNNKPKRADKKRDRLGEKESGKISVIS